MRPLMRVSNGLRAVWKSRRRLRTDSVLSAIVPNSRFCVALRLSSFPNRAITLSCGRSLGIRENSRGGSPSSPDQPAAPDARGRCRSSAPPACPSAGGRLDRQGGGGVRERLRHPACLAVRTRAVVLPEALQGVGGSRARDPVPSGGDVQHLLAVARPDSGSVPFDPKRRRRRRHHPGPRLVRAQPGELARVRPFFSPVRSWLPGDASVGGPVRNRR